MDLSQPATMSGGMRAPASAMAFRRRNLDGASDPGPGTGLDLDEIVDRVVERVEERVLSELQRRGHRGASGVF